jgi:cytochrome c2
LFGGHQVGGRLQLLDTDHLLVTIGDHERDGVLAKEIVSQADAVSYGKTVLVDLRTGASGVYTKGHRNPQGLHIDAHGTIWSTEHGPRGGDELNVIVQGQNYGWPMVTYGTDYDRLPWPQFRANGSSEAFQEPVYAWVPSIGVSSLTSVRTRVLGAWQDDLLVSSLRDKAIWRVHVVDRRIASMERIDIGERIRDIEQDRDGRLVLWTEASPTYPRDAAVVILEPVLRDGARATTSLSTPALRGELVFSQCSGCHAAEGKVASALGPSLRGVVGRRIASEPGFTYSGALSGMSGVWTSDRLDDFLADPARFAPGTAMQVTGVSNQEQRSDLVAYLRTLR